MIHLWRPIYSGDHLLRETLHAEILFINVFWNNELCFYCYYVHSHALCLFLNDPWAPVFTFFLQQIPGTASKNCFDYLVQTSVPPENFLVTRLLLVGRE